MTDAIRQLVGAYVAGELDDAQCERVEALALADPEIAALLDAGLDPVSMAFHELYPVVEPEPAVMRKLRESTPGQSRWPAWDAIRGRRPWIYAGAVGLGILLVSTLLIRSARLALPLARNAGPSEPTVAAIVTHDSLGTHVFLPAGSAPYVNGKYAVSAQFGVAEFDLKAGPSGPLLHLLSGALRVASSLLITVDAGPVEVKCRGGRLGVEFAGWGSDVGVFAYRKDAYWTRGAANGTVPEGRWIEGNRKGFIEDDQLQTSEPPPVLVCPSVLMPQGGAPGPQDVNVESDLTPDHVRLLNRCLQQISQDPDRATPYEEIALMYAKARLRRHAGYVLGRALALDPELDGYRDLRDIEYLMRAVGQPGDRPDLDMPELTDALAKVLAQRNPAKKPYYEAFDAMISADARLDAANPKKEPADAVINAAREVLSFGEPLDQLPAGEALYRGSRYYSEVERHFDAADDAAGTIRAYTDLSGLSKRELAEGHERLGEAVYWNFTKQMESLRLTEKAVSEWPKPHWLVHLAARQVEGGVANYRSFVMLRTGLSAAPSPESYVRVLSFFGLTSRSKEELEREYELAAWVGRAYAEVADAVEAAARDLYAARRAQSLAEFHRLAELTGSFRVPDLMAAADWTVSHNAGRSPDEMAIAQRYGFFAHGQYCENAQSFFALIGDFDQAIKALPANHDMSDENRALHEGMYADRLGRKAEAIGAYRQALQGFEGRLEAVDPRDVAEARVGLAEMAGPGALAGRPWDENLDMTRNSQKYRPVQPFYQARYLWALGEHPQALQMLRAFQSQPWTVENWGYFADPILRRWESEMAGAHSGR